MSTIQNDFNPREISPINGKAWEFIEHNYPNYHGSSEITVMNSLSMKLNGEEAEMSEEQIEDCKGLDALDMAVMERDALVASLEYYFSPGGKDLRQDDDYIYQDENIRNQIIVEVRDDDEDEWLGGSNEGTYYFIGYDGSFLVAVNAQSGDIDKWIQWRYKRKD